MLVTHHGVMSNSPTTWPEVQRVGELKQRHQTLRGDLRALRLTPPGPDAHERFQLKAEAWGALREAEARQLMGAASQEDVEAAMKALEAAEARPSAAAECLRQQRTMQHACRLAERDLGVTMSALRERAIEYQSEAVEGLLRALAQVRVAADRLYETELELQEIGMHQAPFRAPRKLYLESGVPLAQLIWNQHSPWGRHLALAQELGLAADTRELSRFSLTADREAEVQRLAALDESRRKREAAKGRVAESQRQREASIPRGPLRIFQPKQRGTRVAVAEEW